MGSFWHRYRHHVGRDALGRADFIGSVTAAALGVLGHVLPWTKPMIEPLLWQVPLWGLGGLVLARLIVAPHRIWKEDQEKITQLRTDLDAYKQRPTPIVAFDAADPRCVQRRIVSSITLPATHPADTAIYMYALRVTNPSTVASMDEVTISLDASPLAADIHYAATRSSDYPCLTVPMTLHPGASYYVEIGGWAEGDTLTEGYDSDITVRANARDLPESVARFKIEPSRVPAITQL